MTKKRIVNKIVSLCFVAVVFLSLLPVQVDARSSSRRQKGKASGAIPEDKRSWAGAPWLSGIILAGGTIIVALKNSKRNIGGEDRK